MTRLIVCRHADPTRPDGAKRLAWALRPIPLDALYASPLERALATANAIAVGRDLTANLVEALREIDFGEVDGLAFAEYPAKLREALLSRPASVAFPGGESFTDVRGRATRAVDEIAARHSGGTVAVVTHAGPIRALLAQWLGIDGDGAFRLDQRSGAVNVVDWTDGIPFVRLVNGTSVDLG
jgi:broad specificity phosphatase PhoE